MNPKSNSMCHEYSVQPTYNFSKNHHSYVKKSQSWRPVKGYETVQILQLPKVIVTNKAMDPWSCPRAMATKPINFPNFVTGYNTNPGHAARTSLTVRRII